MAESGDNHRDTEDTEVGMVGLVALARGGIGAGLAISPFYDSMIAKLIVHADDRTHALRKAVTALAMTEVTGVTTNRGFLRRILEHPAFTSGGVDTHFIEDHAEALLGAPQAADDTVLATAALFLVVNRPTIALTIGLGRPDTIERTVIL